MGEPIRDELLTEIKAIAQAENRSINEVVEAWLAYYYRTTHKLPSLDSDDPGIYPPGSLGRLATASQRMPPLPDAGENISENADEILRDEFPDYLLKRMNRPADNETDSD